MKRKLMIMSVLFFIMSAVVSVGVLSAKIMGAAYEAKEFDQSTYSFLPGNELKQVEAGKDSARSCDYAFKDKKDRLEVRYILFSEVGEVGMYRMDVAVMMSTLILNMVGSENIMGTKRFDDAQAANDFNCDFGASTTAHGDKTNFTKGYKYVAVSYFCKEGLGFMCQVILFNDTSLMNEDLFWDAFRSFKFK